MSSACAVLAYVFLYCFTSFCCTHCLFLNPNSSVLFSPFTFALYTMIWGSPFTFDLYTMIWGVYVMFLFLCAILLYFICCLLCIYTPITSSDASYLYHIKKHERFIYELFIGSNADIVDKRIHFSMKLLNSNCQNRRHVNIVINMKRN